VVCEDDLNLREKSLREAFVLEKRGWKFHSNMFAFHVSTCIFQKCITPTQLNEMQLGEIDCYKKILLEFIFVEHATIE
jgi:hypothetical protein